MCYVMIITLHINSNAKGWFAAAAAMISVDHLAEWVFARVLRGQSWGSEAWKCKYNLFSLSQTCSGQFLETEMTRIN